MTNKIFFFLLLFPCVLIAQELKPYEVPDGTITQVFKCIYNPDTQKGTVYFAIKDSSKCSIRIYNKQREKVADILVDRELNKGGWVYEYDANFLKEGTYYYTLIANSSEYESIKWKVWER